MGLGGFLKKAAGTALSTAIDATPLGKIVSSDTVARAALGMAKEQDTAATGDIVGFVTDVIQLGTIVKMARADGKVSDIEVAIILDQVEDLVDNGKGLIGRFI